MAKIHSTALKTVRFLGKVVFLGKGINVFKRDKEEKKMLKSQQFYDK